jgi:hypothetical protein
MPPAREAHGEIDHHAARYRALKETAARRGKTIGATIEECLDRARIKSVASAADLVARARRQSSLSEAAALALAVKETRAARRRQQ